MTRTLRMAILVCLLGVAVAGFTGSSQAQKLDLAFGLSTVTAPGASDAINSNDHTPVSLNGGAYPGFSGDALIFHNFGVGAEIFWKASQGDYGGQGLGYRPVLWNINGVYSPRLARHTYLELVGGIGALSTRFYTGTFCNPFTGACSSYQSSNHFDADFGGGLKLYAKGGFFVRPEARFYLVNNNTDFSSNHFGRYGVSIGYTFGGSR